MAPIVNAFSVGRFSQESILEDTLQKNEMFVSGEVVPNAEISLADKVAITRSVDYLTTWTDGTTIPFVPNNFNFYYFTLSNKRTIRKIKRRHPYNRITSHKTISGAKIYTSFFNLDFCYLKLLYIKN